MGYSSDREWSDQYIPAIKAIVGPYLLTPAPFEIDTKQASDLIVLRARDMMVACRVRRPGFADRYPWQFTVRSRRDNGAQTELEKIVNGWADWMFYGHAGEDIDYAIIRWFLLDLAAWRAHMLRDGRRKDKQIICGQQPNGDGTHFAWFDVRSFVGAPALVIASSLPIPRLEPALATAS